MVDFLDKDDQMFVLNVWPMLFGGLVKRHSQKCGLSPAASCPLNGKGVTYRCEVVNRQPLAEVSRRFKRLLYSFSNISAMCILLVKTVPWRCSVRVHRGTKSPLANDVVSSGICHGHKGAGHKHSSDHTAN